MGTSSQGRKVVNEGEYPPFVICFDGHCLLCNVWVDLLIKLDRKEIFSFTTLQSAVGRDFLLANGCEELDFKSTDTIAVVKMGQMTMKSDAVIEILVALKGPFRAAIIFKLIPLAFRNLIYDWIARHRFQWFGRRDSCRVPSHSDFNKFLKRS